MINRKHKALQPYYKQGLLSLFILAFSFSIWSQESDCLPDKPKGKDPDHLVYDLVEFLPDAFEKQLDAKLRKFAKETSNQIVVLTVNDYCGWSANQFSYKVGEKWGIGQAQEDNGLILLIRPKTKTQKGDVYIATGRGLEGPIPDLLAHRIIQEDIIPMFKKGNFTEGIDSATDKIMLLAIGEYDEEVDLNSEEEFPAEIGFFVLFILVVILIIVFTSYRRIKNYAILNSITFAEAATLLNQQTISKNGMGGRSGHRSGSSRWSGGGWSGGSSSGGSSGGGFGGFGGGSFGGGGAGGSW